MSVVASVTSPGFTQEAFDAVMARVMPGDQLPEGCELQIAGPVEQGWRVITVWESPEAFDRFRESKLLPAIRELTDDATLPPGEEPGVDPVYKLITP
jgi:hypothetical protein